MSTNKKSSKSNLKVKKTRNLKCYPIKSIDPYNGDDRDYVFGLDDKHFPVFIKRRTGKNGKGPYLSSRCSGYVKKKCESYNRDPNGYPFAARRKYDYKNPCVYDSHQKKYKTGEPINVHNFSDPRTRKTFHDLLNDVNKYNRKHHTNKMPLRLGKSQRTPLSSGTDTFERSKKKRKDSYAKRHNIYDEDDNKYKQNYKAHMAKLREKRGKTTPRKTVSRKNDKRQKQPQQQQSQQQRRQQQQYQQSIDLE